MSRHTQSEFFIPANNMALSNYLQVYREIERDFETQVASFGLPFSDSIDRPDFDTKVSSLRCCGAEVDNDSKSIHTGWISPSCVQCREGVGTATFLLSVQCPKNCYFCFNPNQRDYDKLLVETNDVNRELDDFFTQGVKLTDIALTGGEPLVHKQETLSFFEQVNRLYPKAYTRLYTSGAYLDEATLEKLHQLNLNEIRFSIKMEDQEAIKNSVLELICLTKKYIENVVVEMPVMPDGLHEMKDLLVRLNDIGIAGINLLELCYPLHNASEFAKRNYVIKKPPYRVLYDYWYAGGLPIAGSEEACLELLEFAIEKQLTIGVHYCSLENKFSGQIFLQNNPYRQMFSGFVMSPHDHFFKTARVFGGDVEPVRRALDDLGCHDYEIDEADVVLSFSPSLVELIAENLPSFLIGIGYCVAEVCDQGAYLKELKLEIISSDVFDFSADI